MQRKNRSGRRVVSTSSRFQQGSRKVAPQRRLLGEAVKACFEGLERRQLLSTYYVNDNWVEQVNSAPGGTAGVVEPGDIVKTNVGDSPAVSNLVYDTQAFASVQQAVNKFFVTGLDTIKVISGTYTQSLNLTDAPLAHALPLDGLRIEGAQSGVDARGRSGQPESIVTTSSADENSALWYIDASVSNVTIDGFTFDGNGPTTGGVTLLDGTTDSNAARGILIDADNVDVTNNIVQNFYRRGVQYGFDAAPTDGTVSQNSFDRIGADDELGGTNSGFAVLAFASPSVIDNNITNVHNGITFMQIYPPSVSAVTVSGNAIAARETGITINESSVAIPTINVTSNSVNTTAAGGVGAVLWTVGGGLNFANNTFTTSSANTTGVQVWAGAANTPVNVTLTGGSISGYATGVQVTNEASVNGSPTAAADTARVNLSGVTLTMPAGGTGVLVEDTAGGSTDVSASLSNTTINGSTSGTGVLLDGALATLVGDTLGNTTFTGFAGSSNYVVLANSAYANAELDGKSASYNGAAGGNTVTDAQGWAIEDRIVHRIDVPGVGLVRIRTGQIYLTTNSFAAPATAASVQRAVDAANSGERVAIQGGTYADNTTLDDDIVLDGEGSGPSALVTFNPATSGPIIRITSTDVSDNVTIADINFNGLNTGGEGIKVDPPANFGTLSVFRGNFTNLIFDAIIVSGDSTTGLSAHNLILTDLAFSSNGGAGGGGTGDVSVFTYNGNATFTNLTMVGNAGANTGEQIALQFRGVGSGSGAGVLPMGTVSLNNIDVSGNYVRSFLGIQRYSTLTGLTMNNVSLGGATSNITGTFGAMVRFDLAGQGSVGSPATVNLGNTHFRGLSNSSAQPTFIEFAPDNTYAFLRANATNTRYDVPSGGTNIAASALTVSQAYEIEDRFFDYVKNLPAGASFKGWAELQNGQAFVTPTVIGPITGDSISRATEVVDGGGTVHIKSGTYSENVNTGSNSVTLSPGSSPGQVTINGNLTLDGNDTLDIEINGTNPATQYDNFIVNGTVTLGGANLNITSTLANPFAPITLIANDGADAVNGQFAQGTSVTVNNVPITINYAGGDGNDVTLSIAAVNTVYVNDNWVITGDTGTPGFSLGDQVSNTGAGDDGTVTNKTFGVDAFDTVQGGVNAVSAAGTVNVLAGNYHEDVQLTVNGTKVLGFGAGTKTVFGAIGGDVSTFRVLASNTEIAGLTITRDGNNVAQWNDPGLNSAGIAIQGQSITGTLMHDNVITGNRTGIDINNSNGHTIRNNQINDNRTGVIFRNQTDNLLVTENEIKNNWTVGILFLDGSGGTNTPPQQALNSTFTNNDISGNWYGGIVDRQSGGSLPAAGTNVKNFSGNWLGTTNPVITTANTTEPGYAGQIPVAFGGTATNPGGAPDVAGPASANFDITPLLESGTDTNVETTTGWGTFGFQGSHAAVKVITQGAQTGTTGRIQEGINLVDSGGTVDLAGGTYADNVTISKAVTIDGEGTGAALVTWTAATNTPLARITDTNASHDISFRDIIFHGINGTTVAGEGIRTDAPANFDTLTIERSIFTGFSFDAVAINGDATNGISAHNLVFTDLGFSGNGTSGGGGSGDISVFQYNGDATFTNLTLVGNSAGTTGEQIGIQFRGVGGGSGSGVKPMGNIALNNIDISGNYVRSFLGIQRYSTANTLSLNNVKLGGATSNITGTFGAGLRFDLVGQGTVAAPATVNLGNTMFRGLSGSSAQRHEIEFAPDNNYAFLKADATGTTWRIGGVDIAASSLTLSQAYAVERRILHYVDKLAGTEPFKGFAVVQVGKAFVTDDPEAGVIGEGSIERASNVVPSNTGIVNVEAGTYNQFATITNPGVKILGAQAGVDARTRTAVPESILAGAGGSLSVEANNVTIDGFTVRDATNAPGAYFSPNFSGYQVLNNIFTDNTFGMYLNSGGATQTLVRHNLFTNNNVAGSAAGNGIYGDQGSKNILIDANKFTGNTNSAMVFAGSAGTQSDITANGNELANNAGIIFFATTNVDITNNTITGSIDHAIKVRGGNNDVTVTGNTVSNSPTANGIDVSDPFGFGPNTAVNISGNNVSGMLNGIAAAAGSLTDTLILSGNVVSNNTNGIHLTGVTASIVGGNDINGNTGAGILVDGGATVTVNNGASPAIRNNFVGIDVNGGTATITGVALNNNTTAIRVMGGGSATLTSNTFSGNSVGLVAQNGSATFTTPHHIDGIAVGNGGLVTVNAGGSNLIVTTSLTITGSGKLDLNDNDMIVDYSGASQRAAIQALINSARNGGTWTGNGLTSTAAKNRVPQNTTLGVMEATEYKSLYGAGALFDGESLDNSAILIKYTYYGDSDFNGIVNFDDYSRLDNGFSTGKTGWLNGDFDGNGVVNFDDYSLIDLAFNTQTGALRPAGVATGGSRPASKPVKGVKGEKSPNDLTLG